MDYYLKRNELILNVLCSDTFNKLDTIKLIIKCSLREAFCYRYKTADIILEAASDFLKGPYYLKTIDPKAKNMEVLKMGEKAVKIQSYLLYMESMRKVVGKQRRLFIVG
ncbi:hypothetical protein [Scytonema sp. NUACC21]